MLEKSLVRKDFDTQIQQTEREITFMKHQFDDFKIQ
jgi:hypothetical protein